MKIKVSGILLAFNLLLFLPGICLAENNQKGNDLEFILDASEGMKQVVEGKAKLQIVKDSFSSVLKDFPQNSYVGARAYGNKYSVSDKVNSCKDSEQIYFIGSFKEAQLSSKINALEARGMIPLEYALKQTRTDFSKDPNYGKVVVLVSAGTDNCGGDPCQAVKEMVASGFNLKVNAIGFGADEKTETQLRCIVNASGGEYRVAKNGVELTAQLKYFSEKILGKNTKTDSVKDQSADIDMMVSGNEEAKDMAKDNPILPSAPVASEPSSQIPVSNQNAEDNQSGSLIILIGAIVVLLLALGGGVFWWLKLRRNGQAGDDEGYASEEMSLPPRRIPAQEDSVRPESISSWENAVPPQQGPLQNNSFETKASSGQEIER